MFWRELGDRGAAEGVSAGSRFAARAASAAGERTQLLRHAASWECASVHIADLKPGS